MRPSEHDQAIARDPRDVQLWKLDDAVYVLAQKDDRQLKGWF